MRAFRAGRRCSLPQADIADIACPICGMNVRVPVIQKFVSMFRQMRALAGVQIDGDFPVSTYMCKRGHIVVVSLEAIERAS